MKKVFIGTLLWVAASVCHAQSEGLINIHRADGFRAATQKIAGEMHDSVWRPDYIAKNEVRDPKTNVVIKPAPPRFKPVPDSAFGKTSESPAEIVARLGQKFSGIELIDGKVQQDINQPSNNLVPELNLKLNGVVAHEYVAVVSNLSEMGAERDVKAEAVHNVWRKANIWQLEKTLSTHAGLDVYKAAPEDVYRATEQVLKEKSALLDRPEIERLIQFREYRDLPDLEQEKDIRVVEDVQLTLKDPEVLKKIRDARLAQFRAKVMGLVENGKMPVEKIREKIEIGNPYVTNKMNQLLRLQVDIAAMKYLDGPVEIARREELKHQYKLGLEKLNILAEVVESASKPKIEPKKK